MNLLEKFDKLNNKLTNLLEENKELKRQNKHLQEENQLLSEKLNKIDYKNLQEENKKLNHALNLEKQKNEQLEIFSQNLEKALGKLELVELDEGDSIQFVKEAPNKEPVSLSNQTYMNRGTHLWNESSWNSFNKGM
jgi:hypothetical protein